MYDFPDEFHHVSDEVLLGRVCACPTFTVRSDAAAPAGRERLVAVATEPLCGQGAHAAQVYAQCLLS